MTEQFANNASTTLNGSINNSTTSVVVTDASVFPSSGNFRLLCGTELMICTSVSSNTLTVQRARESSLAASHTSGDPIYLVYTKGSLEQFISDFELSGGYASRPATPRTGTVYTATNMNARWYYNGTAWDLIWPIYLPNSKKWSSSGWTNQNQSTATFTDQNGVLVVTNMPNNNNAVRGYSKSLPSTPYKATWVFGADVQGTASFSLYTGHRENSSGKLKVTYHAGNTGGLDGVEQWNNFNSFNATVSTARNVYRGRVTFCRVENDGTNFKYSTSHDGSNYTLLYSEAKTLFWTTAADQIFFGFFAGATYGGVDTGIMYLYGYWEE